MNTNFLTADKMQEIFTNDNFCKKVANAHKCLDAKGIFKHFKTCDYPVSHIVTDSQILEAKKQLEKRIREVTEKYRNSIIFTKMGMDRKDITNPDTVNSHRIRAYFLNAENQKFMIEAILKDDAQNTFYFDYAVKFEIENGEEVSRYNYKNLSRDLQNSIKIHSDFTKSHLLDIINKNFDCNFSSVEISNIISFDHISNSPKK